MNCLRVTLIAGLILPVPLLLDPPAGDACGPFIPVAQFGYIHNPGPEFLRGELGIVKPQYYRRNLIVAYRYFAGVRLTPAEVTALSPKAPQPADWPKGLQLADTLASARWLAQRNAAASGEPIQRIATYRESMSSGSYLAYQNCLDDAFDTATATLAHRGEHWGLKSPQTAEWLHGQDQVFANCSGPGPVIPSALPPGADPLLSADRQYQIAAATFYAGLYPEAAQRFREIVANPDSPWRASAPFLAARALIRQGTVNDSREALLAAEKALQAVLDDPARKAWHASAHRLLDLVRARLSPEDRLVKLGAALSKPGLDAAMEQAVVDFTSIWDHLQHIPAERSDLADWIQTFQTGDAAHAATRWRAGGGTAWLVSALQWAEPSDPAAEELIAAAHKIRPADPAYATAARQAIRLLIGRHQDDEARRWADTVLAAKLPDETQNAFRAVRFRLARDFTESLRYAARRPVVTHVIYADEPISEYPNLTNREPTFDRDAASWLNCILPLDRWVDAARSALLPARLQAEIARAGWVRAVVLDQTAQARALAHRVAELTPELAEPMLAYEAERPADAAKFSAVFLMLQTPGLSPVVREGFGRFTKIRQLDALRDNWWRLTPANDNPRWQSLVDAAGVAPDYLCAQTLTWARSHPNDARVPEALHLAVRATRYGQGDEHTSSYSRKAFQLLHSSYSRSEWAAKTKYWF